MASTSDTSRARRSPRRYAGARGTEPREPRVHGDPQPGQRAEDGVVAHQPLGVPGHPPADAEEPDADDRHLQGQDRRHQGGRRDQPCAGGEQRDRRPERAGGQERGKRQPRPLRAGDPEQPPEAAATPAAPCRRCPRRSARPRRGRRRGRRGCRASRGHRLERDDVVGERDERRPVRHQHDRAPGVRGAGRPRRRRGPRCARRAPPSARPGAPAARRAAGRAPARPGGAARPTARRRPRRSGCRARPAGTGPRRQPGRREGARRRRRPRRRDGRAGRRRRAGPACRCGCCGHPGHVRAPSVRREVRQRDDVPGRGLQQDSSARPARRTRAARASTVLFPLPLGPTSAVTRPGRTVNDAPVERRLVAAGRTGR